MLHITLEPHVNFFRVCDFIEKELGSRAEKAFRDYVLEGVPNDSCQWFTLDKEEEEWLFEECPELMDILPLLREELNNNDGIYFDVSW